MMQGRVISAPKILTSDSCVGVHKINDDFINFQQKHPKSSAILENTLLKVLLMKSYIVILTTLMKMRYQKHHL